jgi:23S rRNA (cytosine1962-C5)-methyltransferase
MEILTTLKSEAYELLDSGDGEKLERFGNVVLSRPENQAIWSKTLSKEDWDKADAVFSHGEKATRWEILKKVPDSWEVDFGGLKFSVELLPSKHLGVFPEQVQNWEWLEKKIISSNRKVSVLNLFGYTGGASMACSRAGAEVTHVDASKFAIDLANKNFELSSLKDKPVKYILDDVRKFVEREIKRGKKYDIILMDPPVYGKGAKKEVWKIEKDLMPLLLRVLEILSPEPITVLLNGYASIYSYISYENILKDVTSKLGGQVVAGKLTIKESSSGKLLPCGIFARWEK